MTTRKDAIDLTRHTLGMLENSETYFEDAIYAAGEIQDEQGRQCLQVARDALNLTKHLLERSLYFLDVDKNAPNRYNQPAPPVIPKFTPTPTDKDGRF